MAKIRINFKLVLKLADKNERQKIHTRDLTLNPFIIRAKTSTYHNLSIKSIPFVTISKFHLKPKKTIRKKYQFLNVAR